MIVAIKYLNSHMRIYVMFLAIFFFFFLSMRTIRASVAMYTLEVCNLNFQY